MRWALSSEKLEAVIQLVEEQLKLGHIEPSTSPWNTPIFVIKKKSGKWRLLHDLRAINEQTLYGPVQGNARAKKWEWVGWGAGRGQGIGDFWDSI